MNTDAQRLRLHVAALGDQRDYLLDAIGREDRADEQHMLRTALHQARPPAPPLEERGMQRVRLVRGEGRGASD